MFLNTPEGYLYFKLSPEYEVYCVRLCGFRHKPAHEVMQSGALCVRPLPLGRLSQVVCRYSIGSDLGDPQCLGLSTRDKQTSQSLQFLQLSTKACLVVSLSVLGVVSNAMAFALFFVFHDHDHSNKFLFAYESSYPQEQEKCVLEFSFVFS